MKCINAKIFSVLTATVLAATPVFSQEKSDVFRARIAATRNVPMNVSVSKSDTIDLSHYLNTRAPIYSLSVDAVIEQPREASFTRIVLEDSDGRDWLVMECDRFRNDSSVINLREFCQETALLFGIIPSRLKCYVAGESALHIRSIHFSDQCQKQIIGRTDFEQKEMHKELRTEQSNEVVLRINEYNNRHGKLWRAKVTKRSQMAYCNMCEKGEDDAFTANFKYYAKGIYEMGERNNRRTEPGSQYPDSMTWRNMHGKDWMTSVKDQGNHPYCVAFSLVGMLEANCNVYFNKKCYTNMQEIDLSERDVIGYTKRLYPNDWDKAAYNVVYACNNGVINESTLPYIEPYVDSVPDIRPIGWDLIKPSYYNIINFISNDSTKLDNIKGVLYSNGPCISGYHLPNGSSHSMVLMGYGRISEGEYYEYQPTVPNHISSSDSIIGNTYWIFKNSWGDDVLEGYPKIVFRNYNYMNNVYSLSGEVTSNIMGEQDIVCEDVDGDGLFNWGLNKSKPASCPEWVLNSRDFDDNDYKKGRMVSFKPMNIDPDDNPAKYITTNTVINGNLTNDRYQYRHIYVGNNSTLTITNRVICNKTMYIYLASGATLLIDNGRLINAGIIANSGSNIILNNDSEILLYRRDDFQVPLGVNLQINSGIIH